MAPVPHKPHFAQDDSSTSFPCQAAAAAAASFLFPRAAGFFPRRAGLPARLCSPVGFTIASINAFGSGRRSSKVLPAVFTLAFICLPATFTRSEEHTSELQSRQYL